MSWITVTGSDGNPVDITLDDAREAYEELQNMKVDCIDKREAEHLAQTAMLVYECFYRAKGTVLQYFDECYKIAKEYVKTYPHTTKWGEAVEYDESVEQFLIGKELV